MKRLSSVMILGRGRSSSQGPSQQKSCTTGALAAGGHRSFLVGSPELQQRLLWGRSPACYLLRCLLTILTAEDRVSIGISLTRLQTSCSVKRSTWRSVCATSSTEPMALITIRSDLCHPTRFLGTQVCSQSEVLCLLLLLSLRDQTVPRHATEWCAFLQNLWNHFQISVFDDEISTSISWGALLGDI